MADENRPPEGRVPSLSLGEAQRSFAEDWRSESLRGTAVEVRPMNRDDLDEFLDLFEIVATEKRYIGAEAPIDRASKGEQFLERLDSDRWGSLVAVDTDGAVVGQIGLKDMNGLIEIGMLVAPGLRGKGIGSALLIAGLDWARLRHAHKVTLQLWPDNEAARKLYAKFGFVEEGYLKRQWKRRNGEVWDAIVMGLQL
ncbi:MAG: GNAT family N-acetyltransferase [Actinomycetota bacterium]